MIYILRFSHPLGDIGNPRGHAQYCAKGRLLERLQEHRKGVGAAITRAAVQRGYDIELVIAFPGGREDERKYKNWKNHRRVIEHAKRNLSAICGTSGV